MQDGSQQLGDLPVLRLSEHEHLHSRLDAGVVAQVVAAVTGGALALNRQQTVVAKGLSGLFVSEQARRCQDDPPW